MCICRKTYELLLPVVKPEPLPPQTFNYGGSNSPDISLGPGSTGLRDACGMNMTARKISMKTIPAIMRMRTRLGMRGRMTECRHIYKQF